MSKTPHEKMSTPDTESDTVKMRDENGQIITIPSQKNIFKDALEQGLDLHETAGMEE